MSTTATSTAQTSASPTIAPDGSPNTLWHSPLDPDFYNFPAFYTLQPNLATQTAQLDNWARALLNYCATYRLFRINTTLPLFTNTRLGKQLRPQDARVLLARMVNNGQAEWLAAGKRVAVDAAGVAPEDEAWVWWRSPEEWAAAVYDWVEQTGQKGTVLTFYELLEGDATASRDFHGIPADVLKMALRGMVKRGKASVFGEGDGLGVKFL